MACMFHKFETQKSKDKYLLQLCKNCSAKRVVLLDRKFDLEKLPVEWKNVKVTK